MGSTLFADLSGLGDQVRASVFELVLCFKLFSCLAVLVHPLVQRLHQTSLQRIAA